MKRCFYLLLAAIALRAQAPTDAEIRAILADRIDKLHQNVGIAVGIIDANGRRFVSYGNFSVKDPRPVGNDTVFEIGSTTKVFTSTILADMVQRGEVSLDDPVAKYLPAEVKIPQRGGKQITLLDLATHTSGSAAHALQFRAEGPRQPVRRLHRGESLRVPLRLRADARYRLASSSTRIWASACWARRWRAAPAWTTKRWCARASPGR